MNISRIEPTSEVSKYVKKKESNKSKSKAKANHRHAYATCLLLAEGSDTPYLGSYCMQCGKIYNWTMPTEKIEYGYRMLTKEEVYQKYGHLPKFHLKNIWDKFVPLGKEI